MTTKQIPIWIDCDTGTDDTVAIMLAHALPELQIIGLSAVAGNSLLCNTFPNTRRVVHLLGADYPVYPGAERPLVREPHVAGAFHGENGLGNVQLPLPDTAPEQTPAWDALYAAAKRMPGELRLVATGPLTNVAIALTKYPDLHGLLHSIALMGGAAVGGNVTPAAEFNIYDDPDAAQIVFKSGVPLVMCGLDVTMQAELRPADWDEMAGYGNRCGGLVKELFACAWKTIQTVGLTGVAQHDSCPVMYLAHRRDAGRSHARQDRHRPAERQKIRRAERPRAPAPRPREIHADPERLHPDAALRKEIPRPLRLQRAGFVFLAYITSRFSGMTMAATIYRRMPVPLKAKAAQIRRTIVGSMPKYSATPAQTPQIIRLLLLYSFFIRSSSISFH